MIIRNHQYKIVTLKTFRIILQKKLICYRIQDYIKFVF